MALDRLMEPEWLDELDPDDPRARRARRDLALCNRIMGQARILHRLLRDRLSGPAPRTVVDLGTGDGAFMLDLARRCAGDWPAIDLWLVDRRPGIDERVLQAYAALGWRVHIVAQDALRWTEFAPPADLVLVNLFLHHLTTKNLRALFQTTATHARAFVSAEPLRHRLPWLGSHLLGLLGCGDVARHDAIASVRAGFIAPELSRLWIDADDWSLWEGRAGLLTHGFVATKNG